MTQERTATSGGGKPSPEEVAQVLRGRIRTGVLRPGEPMPTQAALAEEFQVERAAIRQALRHLQEDGLLTAVTRGAPARVAAGPGAASGPLQTSAALGPRVLEAFAAPDVRIDALCLTAESLALAIAEPVQQIRSGRLRPGSVRVRILLPGRHLDLAFPRSVDGEGEPDLVHARWLRLRDGQSGSLRHYLSVLRSTHGLDVEVSLREIPFTPPMKLYLLNGDEALFAYYTVTQRSESIGDSQVEMFDALGSHSKLFAFARSGGGVRDEAFVEQSQQWFDSLWSTIATDLAD
ncbi:MULTISPECIES: winged helix-turn-helix domain-containing protein [unclassified Streptomyces]|uniref:winged helix-turn-helix domain-containing protein n=1 Tax=unclassified Streptomyces TaxID=2593676 RepID=UPI000938ED8B|nr:winged helix-turn-helix domain-containing protein [Streptomyces sp. CB02058]OKI97348.1 GntR family transcriptional regulator [Streptomyces sp. CB02058]